MLESLRPSLNLCHSANQVCSRMWVVASALAVSSGPSPWHSEQARLARSPSRYPARPCTAPGVTLGYLPMDIHGVLAFIGTQTIWTWRSVCCSFGDRFEQPLVLGGGVEIV